VAGAGARWGRPAAAARSGPAQRPAAAAADARAPVPTPAPAPRAAQVDPGGYEVPYDEKNIRRRVYDAINVLMAMNIIAKEKKEIIWNGFPNGGGPLGLEHLRAEKAARMREVDRKAAYLQVGAALRGRLSAARAGSCGLRARSGARLRRCGVPGCQRSGAACA
jgi:hypothetical protein